MAVFLACGDFLQLPPVPETSSPFHRKPETSYEHKQGQALLAGIEHVVDFVAMQRFTDPILEEILYSMRTPGGKTLSEEAWKALEQTQVNLPEGGASGAARSRTTNARLRDACGNGWYESAYEWSIVSFAMQLQTRLGAKRQNKVLYYMKAVDRPEGTWGPAALETMLATSSVTATRKLMGLLPIYVGMEVVLTQSILPPHYVPGATGKVVGLELDPREPSLQGAASIVEEGVVLLQYLPLCIYVRFEDSEDSFLEMEEAPNTDMDLKGVLAIEPVTRKWRWRPPRAFLEADTRISVGVARTQVPILPAKQGTLHGLQGKTCEPGLIAHWKFPNRLSRDSLWLPHYVILSRVRRLEDLLSFGLPQRSVLEGGPPEALVESHKHFFRTEN